jgi:hypothetical protein
MESAKNSSGVVVQGRLLTLREVQTREWTCATCPVDIPVYPSKWPCVLCTIDTRAKNCEHPHFYWKARKERPHRSPCPHWQDAVIVAVDNRVVRSRRGVPGVGPRVIRFDSSARIEAAAGGALGQGHVSSSSNIPTIAIEHWWFPVSPRGRSNIEPCSRISSGRMASRDGHTYGGRGSCGSACLPAVAPFFRCPWMADGAL